MSKLDPIETTIVDPLAGMLGYQLRRASVAAMAALSEALDPLGLTPGEASLLGFVAANDGCTQTVIARMQRTQPANLVPLITRLVQAGIIDRAPGKGRAIALSLTPEGRKLADRTMQVFERHEQRLARSIAPADRPAIIALLRQLCSDACHDEDGSGIDPDRAARQAGGITPSPTGS